MSEHREVESVDEANKIVITMSEEIQAVFKKHLDGRHKGEAWLLKARCLNQLFRMFYGLTISFAEQEYIMGSKHFESQKINDKP